MKKIGLLTAFLAMGMLGSCGLPGATTSAGDPAAEGRAIDLATQQSVAFVSRTTVLIPDMTTSIGHTNDYYNNDYLYLTTQQTVLDEESGKDYVVDIAWEYDKNDSFVREEAKVDDTHITIYFNYSKTEEHDFAFKAKFTCGQGEAKEQNYQVKLLLKNLEFAELSLADIYKPTAANDNFELVDPETGYYKKNNEGFTYTVIETQGEVVYMAPDGNWALIADGNYTLQLYSGSALDLKESKYPALKLGNVVKVQAELGCYYGNLQVSFIFDITQGDPAKITTPNKFRAMSGADFSGKHYWQDGIMNSTRTVNAIYKGNLKNKNTPVEAANLKNNRFTFDIEVDGVAMQVAYDYHVDREDSTSESPLGIFAAYKAKLQTLSVGSSIQVKGTVRFAGPTEKGYNGNENATTWTIVPFLADHFA